jgi:hypothetical protein
MFNYNDNPYVIQTNLYQILDTDYVRYSINAQCDEFGNKSVWILSRNPFFDVYYDSLLVQRIVSILNNYYGNVRTNLSRTDQLNCGYLQSQQNQQFQNPTTNFPSILNGIPGNF